MKIKVMQDYCSTGLWDDETGGSINVPTDIPGYAEKILESWCALYDEIDDSYKDGVSLDTAESYVQLGRGIVKMLNCTKTTQKNEYVWWGTHESNL